MIASLAPQRQLVEGVNVKKDPIVRFESKFTSGPEAECWEWGAGKQGDGYGCFYANGQTHLAHRFSYLVYVGEIPSGMFVCHRCDNPPCVNPSHLFLGTCADNVRDSMNKGRRRTYDDITKLSTADVAAIQTSYTGAWGQQAFLAREYGVHRSVVNRIVTTTGLCHVSMKRTEGVSLHPRRRGLR